MDPELLKKLFFSLLRIRLIEEKIVALYPEWQMRCPVHLCIGQEAVAVGVCSAVSSDDILFSNHRAHGHYLAAGGDLKAFLAEMYGKVTGCCQGKGGSMHLFDRSAGFWGSTPIVGGTIPIATGAAFGCQLKGVDKVVVVFFGDGATEEGVVHEALNFASLKALPIVFVCENNKYSVYTSLAERQPPREIQALVQAHGIPSFQGDGNDVESIHGLAEQAVCRARRGEGPTFLELFTYRWREHCGPNYDNHLGYRPLEEFETWQADCPLERFKARLLTMGVLTEAKFDQMEGDIAGEIEEAVSFAKSSPFPDRHELYQHVYA
ncbi:MAG TPA: thiamine pyrophosphate-dependent dehydrogenase E1 component subunit alpha [Chroococcales cyanobacterium]